MNITSAAPCGVPPRGTEGHLVNLLRVQIVNWCVHVSSCFLRVHAYDFDTSAIHRFCIFVFAPFTFWPPHYVHPHLIQTHLFVQRAQGGKVALTQQSLSQSVTDTGVFISVGYRGTILHPKYIYTYSFLFACI